MDGIVGLSNPYLNGLDNFNRNLASSQNLQKKIENAEIEDEKLMEACKAFEGYFLQMMFKSMRNTIDTSGSVIPQSNAEKIFQDMLDEEVSKKTAEGNNGIGLAQMLYRQLSKGEKNKIVM